MIKKKLSAVFDFRQGTDFQPSIYASQARTMLGRTRSYDILTIFLGRKSKSSEKAVKQVVSGSGQSNDISMLPDLIL